MKLYRRVATLALLPLASGCYASGGYSYGGGYYMGPRYYAPATYVEPCRAFERCGYYHDHWCCADWRYYRYGVQP